MSSADSSTGQTPSPSLFPPSHPDPPSSWNNISATKDLTAFHTHLLCSRRIVALCGAGLSAASGLATFRGAGSKWRDFDSTALATPQQFAANPGLMSLFYAWRKHRAMMARPNRGHKALAELGRKMGGEGFLCLTQNIDGLSVRAGHPESSLKHLHGSLMTTKCSSKTCNYTLHPDMRDPIHPCLSPATETSPAADISSSSVHIAPISESSLPHCPSCQIGLLRPGVVWFGEVLPEDTMDYAHGWIADPRGVDLVLVVGTGAGVWPAAGFVAEAKANGARVAIVNTDLSAVPDGMFTHGRDWFFMGGAERLLPHMLEPVIGGLAEYERKGDAEEGVSMAAGENLVVG